MRVVWTGESSRSINGCRISWDRRYDHMIVISHTDGSPCVRHTHRTIFNEGYKEMCSFIGVVPVFITTTSPHPKSKNKKLQKIMYGYNTLFLSYCFPFIPLS